MMDVTFVLEESGVTATVEVPCEANVAAAKEVACTALAVSPASVEMRIGTQVLEGTCRLQDTAFGAGVQVVLARLFADIKCPAEYNGQRMHINCLSLSPCGALCLLVQNAGYVTGLDTETFSPAFKFKVDSGMSGPPAISQCKTRCYMVCWKGMCVVALPDGELLRKVDPSFQVIACGGVVEEGNVTGLDTETFSPAFRFKVDVEVYGAPAVSRCKTRCYMAGRKGLHEVALPSGEVLRKVGGHSNAVFACGSVVVSRGPGNISVYDEDLTLLRSLSHKGCTQCRGSMAVSDCGGWAITSSTEKNARLWDVNTGEVVARVPVDGGHVALSPPASVFAVVCSETVQLYDWSGAALGCLEKEQWYVCAVLFTPCGKYVVVDFARGELGEEYALHQYDVVTMSCVRTFSDVTPHRFAISPCSRMVVFGNHERDTIVTRHLYPY